MNVIHASFANSARSVWPMPRYKYEQVIKSR
jgi:hypothetical protein